jgi:hypothetical protein
MCAADTPVKAMSKNSNEFVDEIIILISDSSLF